MTPASALPRLFGAGILALATLVATGGPAAAVTTSTLADGLTANDLAQTLAGTGVTITNVSYTGSQVSAGRFSDGAAAIGFASGVVLSSGDAAVGSANTEDSYTGQTGASGAGDSDLDALDGIGAGATRDTSVLEFDVTPNQDTLYFNYVFASDEYNEYVYSAYNDAFGFFITKNGETTKTNCATVADGSDTNTDPDPVTIDTINGGAPYGDANASNPTLYRNNDLDDGGGSIPAEPDGLTTVLQCVASVTPNQPNRLKLAISDVSDAALDSWVFIQAGSISTSPELCGDGIDNDGDGHVDEGCVTNQPPVVSAGGPYTGSEGSPVAITGTASDPEAGDSVTTSWSYSAGAGVDSGASCSFGNAAALSTTVTCTDDGTYTLTLTGNDGEAAPVTSTATLTLTNVAPSTTITTPADMSVHQVGSSVNVSASITDAGANDTHTCSVSWGDGTAPTAGVVAGGTCTASHTYAAIGTYDVTVTVTDDDGGSGSDTITVVIADSQTKVTGGGFVLDDGRYSFGFVAKSGDQGPEGQITVRTHANKHRFHGNTVSALSASGTSATWQGGGRFDGTAGYTFHAAVVDNGTGKKGARDTISVTVRDSLGAVVLQFEGPIQGGNIKVH